MPVGADLKPMKWWGWGDEEVEFDISNRPELWSFIRNTLDLPDDSPRSRPVAFDDIVLPERKLHPGFIDEMRLCLEPECIRDDKKERLTHAFGKSLRDLWRMRNGKVNYAPDCVLYPGSHEDVCAVMNAAARHGVSLIPFGGGTNIAGCLEPFGKPERMTVSVDLRRMSRLLKLDPESGTARFQAGVLGPDLEKQLRHSGFTLGHFPDSFRHSTLGGWVATRSAGMQSDRYGKIEDMVIALKVVTPSGVIETLSVPRASSGIDVNRLCIGSEGAIGIITEVVVSVHRTPERERTCAFLFPTFRSGIEALRRCHREECIPAMARLNDPRKTALSFAFKSAQGAIERYAGKLVKRYLKHVRRMKADDACLMLVTFAGVEEAFESRQRRAEALFAEVGAFALGEGPGRAFQAGKYDFPHLRDFLWDRGVLADVSETATVWSNVLPLYEASTKAIQAALSTHCRAGWVGCHVSHTYHAGASLYFTFGLVPAQGDELVQYLRVKKAAEDSFLQHGATLSHHHAVGWEHQPWLEREVTPAGLNAIRSLKNGVDPNDILTPGRFSADYTFRDWGLAEGDESSA